MIIETLLGRPFFEATIFEIIYCTGISSCALVIIMIIFIHKMKVKRKNLTGCNHEEIEERNSKTKDIIENLLTGPISEEIIFRAIIMQGTGIIVSSILFGLYHFQSENQKRIQPIYTFILGLYLCCIFFCFGLVGSITAHIWFNFFGSYLRIKTASAPQ